MEKINFLILVILLVSSNSIAQSIVIGSGASIYVPLNADICAGTYGKITGNIYGEGTQCLETPVPVELTTFTASTNEYKVILKWETETEVDNYGFDIERSIVNEKWKKLGFVEGHGNSNSPKDYAFTDKKPMGGCKFQYRLKQIDTDGKFEYSEVIEVEIIPTKFALYQNYPNPFNPSTKIKYQIPKRSLVTLKIYDVLGNEIETLVNKEQIQGIYEIEFSAIGGSASGGDATALSSGVYIYKLETNSFSQARKMILLK